MESSEQLIHSDRSILAPSVDSGCNHRKESEATGEQLVVATGHVYLRDNVVCRSLMQQISKVKAVGGNARQGKPHTTN